MSLDTTKLGQVAAELMESLANSYEGYDVEVGTVALIVEVNASEWTAVTYRCSDPRVWIQKGLMRAGISAVNAANGHGEDDDDGD